MMAADEEPAAVRVGTATGTVIFLGFLAAGLLMLVIVGLGFHQRFEPYFWPEVPATILESGVTIDGRSMTADARYRYVWEGKEYISDVLRLPNDTYAHRDEAEALIHDLPAGTVTKCRVDPSRPSRAMLQLNGLEIGRFIVLPALFLWIGANGLRRTFFPRRGHPSLMSPLDMQVTRLLFGGTFAVVGWTLLTGVFLPDWKNARASASWVPTPCAAVDAERKPGAELAYRYTFAGREYVSDRVDFWDGYSNESSGESDALTPLRTEGTSVCYVNPARPYESVLRIGPWGFPWGLLVAGFFLAAGVGIAFSGFFRLFLFRDSSMTFPR